MVSGLKDKMDDKVDKKEEDQKEEDQKEAHPSAQMSDFAL